MESSLQFRKLFLHQSYRSDKIRHGVGNYSHVRTDLAILAAADAVLVIGLISIFRDAAAEGGRRQWYQLCQLSAVSWIH